MSSPTCTKSSPCSIPGLILHDGGAGYQGYSSANPPKVTILPKECSVDNKPGSKDPYFFVNCNSIPVLGADSSNSVIFAGDGGGSSTIQESSSCPTTPSPTLDNFCANIFHIDGMNDVTIYGLGLSTYASGTYDSRSTVKAQNLTNTTLENLNLIGGSYTFPVYFAGSIGATADVPTRNSKDISHDTGSQMIDASLSDQMANDDSLSFSFQKNGTIRNIGYTRSRLALYVDNNVSVTNYFYTPLPEWIHSSS